MGDAQLEAFVQGGRTAVSMVVAPNSTTANADIFQRASEGYHCNNKPVGLYLERFRFTGTICIYLRQVLTL